MHKVLIVDDEIAVCKGLGILIDWNANGFEVAAYACDGYEALEKIKSNDYDVIITDIRMPEIDGIELIKRLKNMNYPAKIIILSGYDDFKYAQAGIEYGVKSYILKPINPKILTDALLNIKSEIERESLYNVYRQTYEVAYKKLIEQENSANNKTSAKIDIKEIIEYVNENCLKKISIQELSDTFFINPSYLGRLFKSSVGMSLNNYIKKLRIEYAAKLLKDTDLLVYEISNIVGYNDINHFYKIFKEIKGVSPSEYRQEKQK